MIRALYIGNDTGWFNGFKSYLGIADAGNSKIELLYHAPCEKRTSGFERASEGPLDDLTGLGEEVDIFLIEESLSDRVSDNAKIGRRGILLCDSMHQDQLNPFEIKGWSKLYKFSPADDIVKRILNCVTGRQTSSEVAHMVICASLATGLTSKLGRAISEHCRDDGKKTLVIGFDQLPLMSLRDVEKNADPLGSLAYYASQGAVRVAQTLDTCIEKTEQGVDMISRCIPFDTSQWTRDISDAAIEGISNHGRYERVIWVLGNTYTSGFSPLLEMSDSIVWVGIEKEMEQDLYYGVYASLVSGRMDLKTHYENVHQLHRGVFDEHVTRIYGMSHS